MKVYINVDPAAAVRAGKLESGLIPLPLTAAMLTSCTDAERDLLASYTLTDAAPVPHGWDREKTIGAYQAGGTIKLPALPDATWETVHTWLATVLAARAVYAEQQAAAREAALQELLRTAPADLIRVQGEGTASALVGLNDWSGPIRTSGPLGGPDVLTTEPRLSELNVRVQQEIQQRQAELAAAAMQREAERQEKIAAAQAARVAAEAAAQRQEEALTAFLAQHADPNTNERRAAGLLDHDEAVNVVRQALFTGLDGFARYQRLRKSEIVSASADADYECEHDGATWSTDMAATLEAEEWTTLKKLRAAAPQGATVTPHIHTGTCSECDGSIDRASALVSLDWHGIPLSREYAL